MTLCSRETIHVGSKPTCPWNRVNQVLRPARLNTRVPVPLVQ